MNQLLQKQLNAIKEYWTSRSKKQKMVFVGGFVSVVALIAAGAFFATRTTLEPLYSNLSPAETGSIKENLDGRGVQSEITDNGTTILVPAESVDTLKVELAAEGIPKSGSIDYSFFSQNAGLGMTENEFNVMKLDAMQTELADLIKGIEGINDAKVMITLPKEGVFVSDEAEAASASIVLNTQPGYQFEDNQIQALYHLVSKSVPDLPTDNIVITNQNFEYFDLNNSEKNSNGSTFAEQNDIKKQIERDIQRQVQSMLGTLMGQDKVAVIVTADVDFTKENREENLVTPVDEENMKGIEVSAQKITETFTGTDASGVPQGEDAADSLGTSYAEGSSGTGDYEKVNDTINYEVNKIRKEIVESPYKVRDLGIQVMVEPPTADDPSSLPQERVDDITKMLASIVRTSIDKSTIQGELTDEAVQDKILVSVQPFNGKATTATTETSSIPWWVYVVGGVLVVVIGLLIFLFIRSRKKKEVAAALEVDAQNYQQISIRDIDEEKEETEGTLRKKQLEKMAKDKPEEFAKLLRTWIAED